MDLLSRYRPTLLAHAVLLGSGLGICQPLLADQPVHRYDLPAAPLADALNRFAEQAGINLPYDPQRVEGKRARPVKGLMPTDMALYLLLEGTGLVALQAADGNWSLQPAAAPTDTALELNSTMIQGQGMGQMTENSGAYTTGLVSIGSKTPTSLRQTPQSVSVITDQLIQDRRMTDLDAAMDMAPGIRVKRSNFQLAEYYSRGFLIENIQLDGAAPMALGTASGSFYSSKRYNLAEFDHVEVLRGSAGLFGGTGDPGGMINLVRKRPLADYQLKFDVSAGSWDNYRSQVDVTGPMGFDGRLRGRLVAAYSDQQYFVDDRSTESPLLYGVLEADLTDDTRITLGMRSERTHQQGMGSGLPRYLDGADIGLPRSTSLTESWAYFDGRSDEYFAKLDQQLSDDWKLNVSYTQTYDSNIAKGAFALGAINPSTGQGSQWFGSTTRARSEQSLLDVNLAGHFELFGRSHELLLGADHQRIVSRWLGTGQMAGRGPVDVFDPQSTPWPEPPNLKSYLSVYTPNDQTQYGAYSTLRLQLADPLHLIVGARVQRYKFEQISYGLGVVESTIATREPTKVTPYGGLVYDLTDQWSAYSSYSQIYKPQQNKTLGPDGDRTVQAMKGNTYEAGIKGELLDGRLNTAMALYYTERENEAIADPRYPLDDILFGTNCCYLPQGKVLSKGIDLEISGELLPDWMLIAGYTYNNNRDRTKNAAFNSITPKHTFKLWSTYQLPGVLHDLKVGAGVTLQSANYVSGTAGVVDSNGRPVTNSQGVPLSVPFDYSQSGYAIWNALAEYRLDQSWTLAYNLNNAFDKVYYNAVGSSSAGNWYGEPRSHMLTLRGVFD